MTHCQLQCSIAHDADVFSEGCLQHSQRCTALSVVMVTAT